MLCEHPLNVVDAPPEPSTSLISLLALAESSSPHIVCFVMPDAPLPDRRVLHHDVPHWVEDGSLYFITLNCAERGRDQLTQPQAASGLLDAARFYHDQGKWHITLFLLMPDHCHAMLSFPRGAKMGDLFKHWKRYTATQFGIVWQNGFFDHRLRGPQEENAKHHYVLHNPVRRGLCERPGQWPHQLRWSSSAGGLVRGGEECCG